MRVYAPIAREADGRADHRAGPQRLRRHRNGEAGLARRSRSRGLHGGVDRRSRGGADRSRLGGGDAAHHPARRLAVRRLTARACAIAAGFEPKKIYEVVYTAKDPALVGVGPAAIRDTISRLKYGAASELGFPQGAIKRAIGFGISQSGRFLRTYLYYGFNEDESHRKVFDGVMAHVAGGGRGSFNHRFAQPSRDGHPYINFFYPTDIFPFTDLPQRDPETGVTDGLLTHATKPEFQPKVFYTNSAYEYWGRAASLIHTTVDGKADMPLPANVRIYLLAAGQHGVAAFPPVAHHRPAAEQPARLPLGDALAADVDEPLDRRPARRRRRAPIRASTTARSSRPTSCASRRCRASTSRPTPHKAYRADYGPDFITKGIVTQEPPAIGAAFPILVPQVDADGNELAGIRMPELSVPLATYTGWNLFNERSGPPTVVSSMQGSFIPLARTRAERERAGDPRRSVDERYTGRDQYLGMISKAAMDLVERGYVLKTDVSRIVDQAGTRWDHVAAKTATQQ